MFTENFVCDASNGQTWMRNGLVRCIRYDEGNAGGVVPKIRVRSTSGMAFDCELIPGRMMKLPEAAAGVMVTNLTSALTLTGKITIGAGDISDNSVVGEVYVIDANRAKVLADGVNLTATYCGSVAAQYPHIAVSNKAVNTKNLAVQLTFINSGTSMSTDVARASGAIPWTAGALIENKRVGYPATTGHEMFKTNNAVLQGSQTAFGGRALVANVGQDLPRGDPPWVLLPNQTLIIRGLGLGADLSVVFETQEF